MWYCAVLSYFEDLDKILSLWENEQYSSVSDEIWFYIQVEELLLSLNICICKVMLSLVIAGDVVIIEEQQDFVRLLNYFEEALNGEVNF